ncbi:hypothetical protein AAF712_010385 [Marasmius tenuissimus]|uniref:F-box domain-containing protein n=1 Tax=Marasmius tenuissimus TaxID=585030 RepID=A0ABR2ZPV1_9AGAR
MISLQELPTDIFVHIFSLLSIPDILQFRQTSQHILALSKLPIVWINARDRDILSRSWPYDSPVDEDNSWHLENSTRNAWRLGCRWSSSETMSVKRSKKWATHTSTAASDVRFLDGKEKRMLLTVSKGIWSVLTLWSIDSNDDGKPVKLSEWSSRGGLFTGLAVNQDVDADERIAVSISQDGTHETLLLTIDEDFNMIPKRRIPTPDGAGPLRALEFSGNLLALADDSAQATIFDRKTGQTALLVEGTQGNSDGSSKSWKHNTPVQILFAFRSILVVRAQSLALFPQPSFFSTTTDARGSDCAEPRPALEAEKATIPMYQPLATHSFGWVDGIDVVISPAPSHDLKIFVRGENNNPWRADEGSIDVYHLLANQDADSTIPPYTFPPFPVSSLSTPRGSIRCSTIRAGPSSTALWICPPSRSSLDPSVTGAGLVMDQWAVDAVADAGLDLSGIGMPSGGGGDLGNGNGSADAGLVDMNGLDFDIYGIGIGVGAGVSTSSNTKRAESIVAGVFPGPLLASSSSLGSQPKLKSILSNTGSTGCTALDYDEASGRVCMGLGDGGIWAGWL